MFAPKRFIPAPLFRRLAAWALVALCLWPSALSAQRQMEKLGRGVIAIRSSSTQVYVGWRLLGNDPDDIAFNLYRSANGATAVKVNASPLTATTDYLDTPANLASTAYTYSVRPVRGGVEVPDTWANPLSGPFTLPVNATVRQYFPVPLQATPDGSGHKVKFCWVGDLDGDGEFDFVVDRYNPTVAARQFLEAYKRDGTFLWRMDMGPNSVNQYAIEPGASAISIGHGDNLTVYDMDGDGKAEVIVRTANGVTVTNAAGTVVTTITDASDTKQFISIIDGLTGAERARGVVPNPFIADGPLQGHMGILYLDGQRPSVILEAKNRIGGGAFQGISTAWNFRNGTLTQLWSYSATQLNQHAPEGHQIRLGDPDNDGKDEFIDIGYGIDDNGTQLFNIPEVVHGDRFHMTDIDPDRPGLETYLIQQNNQSGLATAYIRSADGAAIKKWYANGIADVGRGVVADFDTTQKGLEMFSTQPGIFNAKAEQIYSTAPFPPEAIWWDGDLGREFLVTVGSTAESPAIGKINSGSTTYTRLYTVYNETTPGVYQSYGGRPAFWGDILGDWREELLVVANDNSELRIYSTKNAASARLYTLMHNPQYRAQATTKGYVQANYVDYYLGYGMTPPPPPPMVDAALAWRGGTGTSTWDAGTTASWLATDTGSPSTFTAGNAVRFDIAGNTTTPVVLSGTLTPGDVTVYNPQPYTFTGTGTLAGSMKFTKVGAGALTLGGTHTFTGATTVWDGAFVNNGDLTATPVTVWGGTWGGALAQGLTGGRLAGTGRFGQPVTLRYRSAVTPGTGMGNAGTLTFAAGLVAETGSTLALDLSDDPTGLVKANDRLAITGNLTLNPGVTLLVKPLNTRLAAGTYTLLTYTGTLTGSLANLTVQLPVGTPYTLANPAGAITLTVPPTRAPATITWQGGLAANAWDLSVTQNWRNGTTADVFVAGDTVTFDATGAANPTVTLASGLPTAGVTVNAATDYTFTGSGYLSGPGGITKAGTGVLTVSTANDFTGPVVVNGGTLSVPSLSDAGAPGPLGAATAAASNFVLNGATLRLTGAQSNTNRSMTLGAGGGTLDVTTSSSSLQISGVVTGAGTLTKAGAGTFLVAGANTYTGGTLLKAGTIQFSGFDANEDGLGTGPITLEGGTLSMADVQLNNVANWNLVVPAGASARLDVDGRCSLNGTLTGAGNLTLWTGFIRTDFRGNWSAFTGRIAAIADADGGDIRLWNPAGFAGAELNLGDNVSTYYQAALSANLTVPIGALSGTTLSYLRGGPTGGRTLTWQVGGKNVSTTFSGALLNGTGPTALTKVGTGTLTLAGTLVLSTTTTIDSPTATLASTTGLRAGMPVTGTGIPAGTTVTAVVDTTTITLSANATTTGARNLTFAQTHTHTGATTVSAGTLAVNAVITASPVTVASGATLTGTGLVASTVAISSGGTLGGTGTYTGAVTFSSGATLLVGTTGAPTFTGPLTLNGTINITTPTSLASGTYTLFTYAGTYTGTPTFTWGTPGYTATFNTTTPGVVSLTLVSTYVRPPGPITWSGAASATWDTAAQNFTFTGGATAFVADDIVTFDDTSTATAVTLTGALAPASVTVNSTKAYTFSGAGALGGAATLTKAGTGSLRLTTAHTFTGGTTLSGGTLALGADGSTSATTVQHPGLSGGTTTSLGTGPVTITDGGQLRLGGRGGGTVYTYTLANPLLFDGGTLVSYDGLQRLTGGITLAGPATWITAWNTKNLYVNSSLAGSGALAIDDLSVGGSDSARGIVRIDSADNPYTGTITLNNASTGFQGGRLQLENTTALARATVLNANTAITNALTFTVASAQLGALGGAGAIALPTTSLTVGGNGTSTTYAGAFSGSGSLLKTGTGTLTLSGTSTHTGATSVNAGALVVNGALGTTAVTVATDALIGGTGTLGGNLTLASGATLGFTATGRLTVAGTTTLNGDITVTALDAAPLPAGTYTVLTYTGTLAGTPDFTWAAPEGSPLVAFFDTATPGQVKLTLLAPPAAPANLTATAADASVALTWSPVAGATAYNVLRSTTPGAGYTVIANALTSLTTTDTTAANATTYHYVVVATNPAGTSAYSNEATATPAALLSAFDQWRVTHFGTLAGTGPSAPAADPDGDGLPNLLEYALGTLPTQAASTATPTLAIDAGKLTLTFPRIADPTLTYTVLATDDLTTSPWPAIWTSTGPANTAGPVTVADTVFLADHPRRFLRLQVTQP